TDLRLTMRTFLYPLGRVISAILQSFYPHAHPRKFAHRSAEPLRHHVVEMVIFYETDYQSYCPSHALFDVLHLYRQAFHLPSVGVHSNLHTLHENHHSKMAASSLKQDMDAFKM